MIIYPTHPWIPEILCDLARTCSVLGSPEVVFYRIFKYGGKILLLKPMYSFGKWWKWKISLMGFVYRVVLALEALWIILSETINILRKLHKTNIFGDAPENSTIELCT